MARVTSETALDKANTIRLSRHRDESAAHLPAPGRIWAWGETELSHACLSQLKDPGTSVIQTVVPADSAPNPIGSVRYVVFSITA